MERGVEEPKDCLVKRAPELGSTHLSDVRGAFDQLLSSAEGDESSEQRQQGLLENSLRNGSSRHCTEAEEVFSDCPQQLNAMRMPSPPNVERKR